MKKTLFLRSPGLRPGPHFPAPIRCLHEGEASSDNMTVQRGTPRGRMCHIYRRERLLYKCCPESRPWASPWAAIFLWRPTLLQKVRGPATLQWMIQWDLVQASKMGREPDLLSQ